MRKTILTAAAILMAGSLITGCTNTFDGAGRDIENAGEWVQDTF